MSQAHEQITIIGHKEGVDFPDQGLVGIPSKIDTGADSSAIWASSIREENRTLFFVLFDKVSPFYNGTVLSTKNFSVTSVRNSFGHTEFRYKVTLKAVLAGRTIRARFTLANRAQNSQPILIGRRTLHGKFLVDVAAENARKNKKRLLLMSTQITANVASFVRGVEAASENFQVTHAVYDDVQFVFGSSGMHITLLSTGEDIASFDIVHFKTSGERDVTAAMARYLKQRGIRIVDESVLHFAPSSKLYQYVILADNNIAIPTSLYMAPSQLAGSYKTFQEVLGAPFVLKGIHASRGDHNYLIRNADEFEDVVNTVVAAGVFVIGQAFIPNDGDYRILVFGRRIALVIHRSRTGEATHLNNTSQGGDAKIVEVSSLPTAVQTDSITAARVMEHGAAGVDMVQDLKTGLWYCFEVNSGPQLATGSFVAEKQKAFAKFIEVELNK